MPAIPLQALIFDVDGTLADTERDGHRIAFNDAFREAGLDWRWDVPLYGELLAVTGGKERIRHYLQGAHPSLLMEPGIDARIAALHKAKTRHYVELVSRGGLPLRPGVARLIQEARANGLRLAIATTTTPENVSVLLKHSLAPDAVDWFEVIGAGDIVPAKKPAPDIYRWVLDQLGLPPRSLPGIRGFGQRPAGIARRGPGHDRDRQRLHGRPRFHRCHGRAERSRRADAAVQASVRRCRQRRLRRSPRAASLAFHGARPLIQP